MTIKDLFKKRDKVSVDSFNIYEFSRPEIPKITEKKSHSWVEYGDNNDYPDKLTELINTSAIHNAIVDGKALMMAGDGIYLNNAKTKEENESIYNSLDVQSKKNYDNLVDIFKEDDILKKCAYDFQKNGSLAVEFIYSLDFSKIAKIKFISTDKIRSGKFEDDKITEYWYSRDWSQHKKDGYKPERMAAFDKNNKKEYNQLLFIKRGNLDYYGEPSYKGALSWIKIDSQMGIFHLSNIENGFAPSLTFKFYKKPASPQEQDFILDNIKRQFGGAKNSGKALIFFSDGKENAPDVEPVNVSNLDKQYLLLSELAVQNILSGHKVTNPLLFGLSVPGKLGGSNELEKSYKIFHETVIKPEQIYLNELINIVNDYNNYNLNAKIREFNPF